MTLGREEVEGVVDAVFVTLRVGCAQSMYKPLSPPIFLLLGLLKFFFFETSGADSVAGGFGRCADLGTV